MNTALRTVPKASDIIDYVIEDDLLMVAYGNESQYRNYPLDTFLDWVGDVYELDLGGHYLIEDGVYDTAFTQQEAWSDQIEDRHKMSIVKEYLTSRGLAA